MAIAKQIQDYPDYYVSSAGNVWREKNNEFYLMLKPQKKGKVNLYPNGEHKRMYIHRLVAQAFVPIPEQYQGMSIDELEVHHINFNHSDNRASNLMWLTKTEHKKLHSESEVTKHRLSAALKGRVRTEETKHRISAALKGKMKGEYNPMYGKHHSDEVKQKMSAAKKGKPNLTSSKAVIQYTKDGEFIAEYASTMEAERQTKVHQSNISNCCKGKYKSAGGFIWKFAS